MCWFKVAYHLVFAWCCWKDVHLQFVWAGVVSLSGSKTVQYGEMLLGLVGSQFTHWSCDNQWYAFGVTSCHIISLLLSQGLCWFGTTLWTLFIRGLCPIPSISVVNSLKTLKSFHEWNFTVANSLQRKPVLLNCIFCYVFLQMQGFKCLKYVNLQHVLCQLLETHNKRVFLNCCICHMLNGTFHSKISHHSMVCKLTFIEDSTKKQPLNLAKTNVSKSTVNHVSSHSWILIHHKMLQCLPSQDTSECASTEWK